MDPVEAAKRIQEAAEAVRAANEQHRILATRDTRARDGAGALVSRGCSAAAFDWP
jgi:hypothetical protein